MLALPSRANGDEEAAIELHAIDADRINLIRRVGALQQAVASPTARGAAHMDDVGLEGRPLALDPDELRIEIEDEVVPPPSPNGKYTPIP